MSVKKFLTKMNSLKKYAFGMASLERGKLDVFMRGLRLDIANDVMIKDNPPKTFSKAFNLALRSKL